MGAPSVVVVGAGLGGMAAAIAAAELGCRVTLVEKGARVGGAAAYSGGQVWVAANHVEARLGLDDDLDSARTYVQAAASRDAATVDVALAREWLAGAADAAAWFEALGVIEWDVVPDYPDYYFPDLPGSRPTGRYLTGRPFDGSRLGEARGLLHVSPHFPVGITYPEMFSWGGMSSRTTWDWALVERRRADDVLTFGTGIAAAFFRGVLDRDVEVLIGHEVVSLIGDGGEGGEGDGASGAGDGRADEGVDDPAARARPGSGAGPVVGVQARAVASGELVERRGAVILATGAHDWSAALAARFTGIPPEDGGSVAPSSLTGDAVGLVEAVGGHAAALPPWAAPVLPGYRLPEPRFEGDTRYRACFEHCLPHTFIVDRSGTRFCDDSFHSRIVAAALGDEVGEPVHLPIFMVWDERHHRDYGLGSTMPGEDYPTGLVTSAPTLEALGAALGIDGAALAATADRFNGFAVDGVDPDFGRGSNLSVRRFRGDGNNRPNPCLGTVAEAPFHGMRLRLLNTGIAAAGVASGVSGRVLRADGSAIPGLFAAGECSARAAAGVGYNSGYSLSRAMAFGVLAARAVASPA